MQHRNIFQHNTVLLASIIVQLAESTVYSLLAPFRHLIVPKTGYIDTCNGKFSLFSLLVCWLYVVIICDIQFTTPGLALGSKVKSLYIIEHNMSKRQLPLEA